MSVAVKARLEMIGRAEAALDFIAQAARAFFLHAPREGKARIDDFFDEVRV